MKEVMLWGPPVVESAPTAPGYYADIEAWVRKCADSGVTRIIISGGWTPTFAEVALASGLSIGSGKKLRDQPYITLARPCRGNEL